MHLSIASSFLLEQLLLVYKQITPVAAIPPLRIFFLMILRKTKLNDWFRKALVKLMGISEARHNFKDLLLIGAGELTSAAYLWNLL